METKVKVVVDLVVEHEEHMPLNKVEEIARKDLHHSHAAGGSVDYGHFRVTETGRYVQSADELEQLQQQLEALQIENEGLKKDRDHWKANHNSQVEMNQLLRQRPDMPIERIQAYDKIMHQLEALQRENEGLKVNFLKATQALAMLLEVKDHKDKHGKDEWYAGHMPIAWRMARESMYGSPAQSLTAIQQRVERETRDRDLKAVRFHRAIIGSEAIEEEIRNLPTAYPGYE